MPDPLTISTTRKQISKDNELEKIVRKAKKKEKKKRRSKDIGPIKKADSLPYTGMDDDLRRGLALSILASAPFQGAMGAGLGGIGGGAVGYAADTAAGNKDKKRAGKWALLGGSTLGGAGLGSSLGTGLSSLVTSNPAVVGGSGLLGLLLGGASGLGIGSSLIPKEKDEDENKNE